MNKRIGLVVVVILLLISGLTLLPVALGEPTTQDATAQQQTIDAIVQERFTQTAVVQQQAASTQMAQTQAAISEPPSPPTQTAAFQETVDAAFSQAIKATAQVEMMATVTARGLEVITSQNLPRLEQLGSLDPSVRDVTRVAFSPDGKMLATGSLRGAVRLWNPVSGAELRRLSGHAGDITSIAFSPDSSLLVSSSRDGTVRLWNTASGAEILAIPGDTIHSVAFSSDGRHVAMGGQSGTVTIWDIATGAQTQSIPAQVGIVRSVAFNPNNRQIAVGGDADAVQIWDIATAALVYDLPYGPEVTAVIYSPDGLWLVAASKNAPLRQWDATAGVQVWSSSTAASYDDIAFSPDGLLIASVSLEQEALALWDAATGAQLALVKIGNPVLGVAFSPDGAGIATAGGTVRLWGVRPPGTGAPATASESQPTPGPQLPTLTPRPGATPRPEIFPTDTLAEVQIVEQVFEHGRMFWIRHNRQIWVMVDNPAEVPNGGDWYCYNDTFEEGEPETDPSLIPPDDLIQPKRGFGKLWRGHPDIQSAIGWATTPEFDLISYYTYIAGGYVQNGQYYPGPGEHRLTTLYGESISFFEREIRGDCVGGTWQPTAGD
jgi:WD40 repeat protein